jgi:putative transposase
MSRHPRIHFPGALYHVTMRGNRRASMFADAKDHLVWQDTLAEVVERFALKIHAFCLMPNHVHMLVETPQPNLSKAMHLLNGSYARRYNGRHSTVGHLIQGRYHAVLIERESQLVETARYIALNPVRAGLVTSADAWRWSSHRYCCGHVPSPEWLTTSDILDHFHGETKNARAAAYARFVSAGLHATNPLAHQPERINRGVADRGIPRALQDYLKAEPSKLEAMAAAFASGAYSRRDIADFFGVSTRTVSRAIAGCNAVDTAQPVSTFVTDPEVDTDSAIETSGVGIIARKVV